MQYLLIITLLIFSSMCFGQDRDSLLIAWEEQQKNSPEVESFEKISNLKYKIKLSKLQFEGELKVLTYDIEEIGYEGDEIYTKMGYVEVELVGASEELITKYGRSYSKWAENNSLFLNNNTGKWVTRKQYSKEVEDKYKNNSTFTLFFFEYWNYLLVLIILYFFVSTIRNNKNIKESIKFQEQAKDNITQSLLFQNEAKQLHRETNEILEKIYQEIKKRQ